MWPLLKRWPCNPYFFALFPNCLARPISLISFAQVFHLFRFAELFCYIPWSYSLFYFCLAGHMHLQYSSWIGNCLKLRHASPMHEVSSPVFKIFLCLSSSFPFPIKNLVFFIWWIRWHVWMFLNFYQHYLTPCNTELVQDPNNKKCAL